MRQCRLFAVTLAAALIVVYDLCLAQEPSLAGRAEPSAMVEISSVLVSPASATRLSLPFTYLGAFTRRGKFRDHSAAGSLKESLEDAPGREDLVRSAPPWMFHGDERTVQDVDPAILHKTRTAGKPHAGLASLFNPVVESAYGGPIVLHKPTYVTADTRHRLIVTDAGDHSVHVLTASGRDSFRIVAGKEYRLKAPAGVAADAAGNIYIADSEAGVVLVYDERGNFVKRIGTSHGENLFSRPTSLAIDQSHGWIYVADTPRDVVEVMSLEGRIVRHLGGRRSPDGLSFHHPSAIAVEQNGVAVLDSNGLRVTLLNSEGKLTARFSLGRYLDSGNEMNDIALDRQGNLYVTSLNTCVVVEVNRRGELLGLLGRPGSKPGEFMWPAGVWLDLSGTMYVADSVNGRVQVFQVPQTPLSTNGGGGFETEAEANSR